MAAKDVAGVLALAAEEASAPHWPAAEYYRMLGVIARTPERRGAWVLLADADRVDLEIFGANCLRGFAMASHVAGICDLEAVVVGHAWRGRRLGEALVEAAAEWGRTLGAGRLQLEVRASNIPALRLYQRMGFAVDGRRLGYYCNPEEDAVLMGLPL